MLEILSIGHHLVQIHYWDYGLVTKLKTTTAYLLIFNKRIYINIRIRIIMKTIVIALGGNALLQRGEILSAENQYKNIELMSETINKLAKEYRVVLVHGNGPQVGLLALQKPGISSCSSLSRWIF